MKTPIFIRRKKNLKYTNTRGSPHIPYILKVVARIPKVFENTRIPAERFVAEIKFHRE